MSKAFFGLLFLFLVSACEPPVTFDQPQPPNTNALKSIPKRLHGRFLSLDSTSTVLIQEKEIITIFDYYSCIHKDSLKEVDSLSLGTNTKILNVKNVNDTIMFHVNYTDTLFTIDSNTVLKNLNGNYFLNYRWAKNEWIVKKVTLVKGILSIADIQTEEGVKILTALTETPTDTITYNFKTSKKQFKQFIKLNGFQHINYYIKVK